MHCRRSHRDAGSIPFTSLGVGEPPMGGFSRDLQLVRLATQRTLQLGDLAAQLPLTLALVPARERLQAALKQLVAPRVVERVRDLMLATDLLDGTVAAQPGQHDRDLLLGRPRPVLPLLAQPRLLVGRAAHAEPGTGRSLRGSAPPRPSRHSNSTTCQRGTGERGNKMALSGRLVTMDEHFTVIDDGVIYIDAGRIVAAQSASDDAPPGFEQTQPVAVQGTIYPGLIELHNHLSYDALQLWQVPKRYTNRDQWGGGGNPEYRPLISGPMSLIGPNPALMPGD